MAQIVGNKRYAVVDTTTELFNWLNFGFSYDDAVSSEPVPSVSAGSEAVPVTDLGGLTEAQFLDQKKPVIVSEAFDSWADKASAPDVAIDVNPLDDQSNAPTITLSNGPLSTDFDYMFSRPVACNLEAGTGSFDGSGDATFKLKVLGQGPLSLVIQPRGNNDFQSASFDITVEAAPF